MTTEYKDQVIIDEERIQFHAERILSRKLTIGEYENVFEIISKETFRTINYSIREVINYNESVKRNAAAKNIFPHYRLFWRSRIPDYWGTEFMEIASFANLGDAYEDICHNLVSKDDNKSINHNEWKLVCVELDGTQREIYKSF